MVPEINYWSVILATVAGTVVGAVWYGPKTFGPRWARLARVVTDRPKGSAAIAIGVSTAVTFATAWVLAGATTIAWHFYSGSYLWAAIVTAVLLWAGFTAARVITHDGFEGRPSSLTVITIGYELTVAVVMAVIIGLWPPAGTV
ncbi:DUF1761 domain-containing protein [Microbacterium oleivorans]|uniref:DUF1761 domain-containing protein n=1 Tax=Microbacterium oleivorans TaxID=273677 RepID=UPI00203E6386|nr:DUF1761 domain-containing protein [Microbacterium oleivorans]MCM3695049.1 DUF1761 domain-containing protein [Microbacterium oleivorans]